MDRLPPFDSLNTLRTELDADYAAGIEERKRKRQERIDEILEMLIMAYMYGNESANFMLYGETSEEQTATERPVPIRIEDMDEAVFREVAGKNWEQRVTEYINSETGTVDDVIRVVDTDMNRVYNDSILNVAEREHRPGKPIMKTWETMQDDRVRDTHEYLQSMTVPYDRRFYTYDGDSARYPGDFADPANNCNCRCRILISRSEPR